MFSPIFHCGLLQKESQGLSLDYGSSTNSTVTIVIVIDAILLRHCEHKRVHDTDAVALFVGHRICDSQVAGSVLTGQAIYI